MYIKTQYVITEHKRTSKLGHTHTYHRKKSVLVLRCDSCTTMFFRDKHVFDALKNSILPKIIQSCSKDKTIRIWCSAVSTGQEAYSIAMTLREFFPELSSWNIFIQATDISPNILTKAKSGIYSQSEINRGWFNTRYFNC